MSIFTEAQRDHLQDLLEADMTPEELSRIFDKLKPKQKIELAMKAVMGHGGSETGTYTPYVVGRKSTSKKYGVVTIHLKNADGSKPHPMRKVSLYKRGDKPISVAIGDMGARLIGIKVS